jgi:hypothetical protein
VTKAQRLQRRTLAIQSSRNERCRWCNRVGGHGKHCKRPYWIKRLEQSNEMRREELVRDPTTELPTRIQDAIPLIVRARAARFLQGKIFYFHCLCCRQRKPEGEQSCRPGVCTSCYQSSPDYEPTAV